MRSAAHLGLAAGVFFLAPGTRASAQVVVPPASEVPVPPKPATDTASSPKADSIQPPFGRAVGPRTVDIGPQYEWNREEMFASGALTVADLLERIPEITTFRSGWIASPKFAAVNGDLNRIRIYYDGIEMDNLDPRSKALLDLTTIELWSLEHVLIERFANEIKVHLRSWRVEKTEPYTRTDIFTGDEDTNLYRGFYGKRYGNGAGLQLAGQQFSTRASRLGGGGDALSFMGRIGIARRGWSVDAFALRRSGSRTLQPTFSVTNGLSIPPYDGTHTLGYIRAGVGNPAGGPWGQIVASQMRFADRSDSVSLSDAASNRLVPDTTDTTTSRIQLLGSVGVSRGAVRVSAHYRLRAVEEEIYHSPSARLDLSARIAAVSVSGESDQLTRAQRVDVTGRLTPLPFVAVAGALSTSSPFDSAGFGAPPKWTSVRAEVGIRVLNPWLIGGFISRDTAMLVGLVAFDTAYSTVRVGKRQGVYAGLRGKLFRSLNADIVGTRWDSAGFYQPRYQARSEVNLITRWMSRFPSGNFGLKAAFVHDYRSRVNFPTVTGIRQTPASGIMSGLLEIRILRGVASYQVRNIASENYQIVPDFLMPRTINIYGIRWEFWN